MEEQEIINFLEWAQNEGHIRYTESQKIEIAIEYIKNKTQA